MVKNNCNNYTQPSTTRISFFSLFLLLILLGYLIMSGLYTYMYYLRPLMARRIVEEIKAVDPNLAIVPIIV